MKYLRALLLVLLVPSLVQAQAWNGILSSSRATDWSTNGVVGDIPSATWTNCTTAACNTLFGGTVTATSIQNALASCPANNVVRIPAGSFSVGAFNFTQSNCVLRGAGADQTKLTMTGNQSGAGFGGVDSATIHLMSGANGVGVGAINGFPNVSQTANWTAGYAQGTTVITLDNTTGLVAGAVGLGTILFLDQTDDTSDGWPSAGDLYICANSSNLCSNNGGGNSYGRHNGSPGSSSVRSQIQAVSVTAINGSQVTISPGVMFPNIRSGQNPGAYWNNTLPINNAGIEDLSIDFSGSSTGLFIANGVNVWATRLRFVNTDTNVGSSGHFSITTEQSQHVTIRSNYFWGPIGGSCASFPLDNYQTKWGETSNMLVENNIYDTFIGAVFPNDPSAGNVISYNFAVNGSIGVGGIQPHGGGLEFDLVEGNTWETSYFDVTHGTHFFYTSYRNLFNGKEFNSACAVGMAFGILSNNRFMNAVANVIGSTDYTAYEANLESYGNCGSNAVFNLGGAGCNSGTSTGTDTNVKRTLMRWGNWDLFTSTNRTGTNDQTGTRFVTSEVPSGITNFPNPIPSCNTPSCLPASFYLASKPSWFGSVAYPPIGPDVTNGNATNNSTIPSGGHANLIPARVCFASLSNDPGYSTSPPVKIFNGTTCYGQSSTAPAITLNPASLSFGGQIVTTSSNAKVISVTNTGTAPLGIISIALTGTNPSDYLAPTTCLAQLGVGNSCQVNVIFTPSAAGTRTANLTFTTNAASSPNNVPLTGLGFYAITGTGTATGAGIIKNP